MTGVFFLKKGLDQKPAIKTQQHWEDGMEGEEKLLQRPPYLGPLQDENLQGPAGVALRLLLLAAGELQGAQDGQILLHRVVVLLAGQSLLQAGRLGGRGGQLGL